MNSESTSIILVRHGETEWNRDNRLQGNKNSPLTEQGISQAYNTGKILKNIRIDKVYSSPLQRAVHTAKIITDNRNLNLVYNNNLKEINLGPWEGKTKEETEFSDPEEYLYFWKSPERFSLPGAESYTELQQRMVNEINRIFEKDHGKTVLLISHWIAIKTAVAYYNSIDISLLNKSINLSNGKFLILTKTDNSVSCTQNLSVLPVLT